MKKFKFVEVAWMDAVSVANWRSFDDLPEIVMCVNRGWVVRETDKSITLAGSLMFNGANAVSLIGDVTVIPKAGMVAKIKRLKV